MAKNCCLELVEVKYLSFSLVLWTIPVTSMLSQRTWSPSLIIHTIVILRSYLDQRICSLFFSLSFVTFDISYPCVVFYFSPLSCFRHRYIHYNMSLVVIIQHYLIKFYRSCSMNSEGEIEGERWYSTTLADTMSSYYKYI